MTIRARGAHQEPLFGGRSTEDPAYGHRRRLVRYSRPLHSLRFFFLSLRLCLVGSPACFLMRASSFLVLLALIVALNFLARAAFHFSNLGQLQPSSRDGVRRQD